MNFKNSLPNANKAIIHDHMIHSTRSNYHNNVEEYLDTIKHENFHERDKLFNREEFIKNQEIFPAKKKGSLKTYSHKH